MSPNVQPTAEKYFENATRIIQARKDILDTHIQKIVSIQSFNKTLCNKQLDVAQLGTAKNLWKNLEKIIKKVKQTIASSVEIESNKCITPVISPPQ